MCNVALHVTADVKKTVHRISFAELKTEKRSKKPKKEKKQIEEKTIVCHLIIIIQNEFI